MKEIPESIQGYTLSEKANNCLIIIFLLSVAIWCLSLFSDFNEPLLTRICMIASLSGALVVAVPRLPIWVKIDKSSNPNKEGE
ncbi:TPA: hypothetical protein PMB18_001513 [Vibrio cholerae]|nr:hypothetical protein [Vibrio cholerae]